MAAEDFEIKVRITADTAQVAQIERALTGVGAQVDVIKAKAATAATAGPAVTSADFTQVAHMIGSLTGIGLGASIYEFVNGLKKASDEIGKISEQLDKQGAQLVKNAQLQIQQATHAKDESDVLKVSDATLKDIETTRKTFDELSRKELGYAAQASDYLQKQLLGRQRLAGMGDYEAARLENLRTAESQYLAARQKGMDQVLAAEEAENKTFEEKEELLNREIALEEQRKVTALSNIDPGGYAQAANNVLKLRKELDAVIERETRRQNQEKREAEATAAEHEKDVDFWQKQLQRASPQVQAVLKQEEAARTAAAEGRTRDVELFEKSAEAFKRGMTPQQAEELRPLENNKDVVEAINRLADLWK